MVFDILILGAGWTSDWLVPLLDEKKYKVAKTTTTGRSNSIKFRFDPGNNDSSAMEILPECQTILITFPLTGVGQSRKLIQDYYDTHSTRPRFIQLGSTGIWQIDQIDLWITRHSSYNTSDARAIAEDELISLGGVVLNLAGLWGGKRQPRDFVSKIFRDKQSVRDKGSLHMIHGRDVARSICAVMEQWPGASRWMLTDMFVYDWWSLIMGWGSTDKDERNTEQGEADNSGAVLKWVQELMVEHSVKALPRNMESLSRCYDSREFWKTFKLTPARARI